jgi:hypothetical protein
LQAGGHRFDPVHLHHFLVAYRLLCVAKANVSMGCPCLDVFLLRSLRAHRLLFKNLEEVLLIRKSGFTDQFRDSFCVKATWVVIVSTEPLAQVRAGGSAQTRDISLTWHHFLVRIWFLAETTFNQGLKVIGSSE